MNVRAHYGFLTVLTESPWLKLLKGWLLHSAETNHCTRLGEVSPRFTAVNPVPICNLVNTPSLSETLTQQTEGFWSVQHFVMRICHNQNVDDVVDKLLFSQRMQTWILWTVGLSCFARALLMDEDTRLWRKLSRACFTVPNQFWVRAQFKNVNHLEVKKKKENNNNNNNK